jgi:hypothetical protein
MRFLPPSHACGAIHHRASGIIALRLGRSAKVDANSWKAHVLYNEYHDQYQSADEVGFDGIMTNEHHSA